MDIELIKFLCMLIGYSAGLIFLMYIAKKDSERERYKMKAFDKDASVTDEKDTSVTDENISEILDGIEKNIML